MNSNIVSDTKCIIVDSGYYPFNSLVVSLAGDLISISSVYKSRVVMESQNLSTVTFNGTVLARAAAETFIKANFFK